MGTGLSLWIIWSQGSIGKGKGMTAFIAKFNQRVSINIHDSPISSQYPVLFLLIIQ